MRVFGIIALLGVMALTAGFMAVGLAGAAGWVILVTAVVVGFILWARSMYKPGMSLLAPLVTWFLGYEVFEWVTHLYNGTWSSFFMCNGLNNFLHIPPVFKWWGFVLFLIGLVFWRLTRVAETQPGRRALYARLCWLIMGFLWLVASCSLNWSDLPPFSRTGDHPAATALVAPKFVLKDNGNLTFTATVPSAPSDGDKRQYQWKVYVTTTSKEVPNAVPGQASKVTSNPLPSAGNYTVRLVVSKGQKSSEPLTKSINVTGPDGKSPPVDPNQTVAKGCPKTWVIHQTDHVNYALTDALQGIRDANDHKSEAEARQAWKDWIELAKADTATFAFVVDQNLGEQVDTASLVDAGCASALAKSYETKLLALLDNPDFHVTPELAPANGTNTGWDNGRVVQNAEPGITGDRRAIKVVLPNGRTYWVLARCGNVVFLGESPVSLPKGHTGAETQQVEAAGPTSTPGHPASSSSAHRPGPTSTPARTTTPHTTPVAHPTHKVAPAGNNSATNPAQWGNGGASPSRATATATPTPMQTIAPVTEGSHPVPAASSSASATSSSAYPTTGPSCDMNGNGC